MESVQIETGTTYHEAYRSRQEALIEPNNDHCAHVDLWRDLVAKYVGRRPKPANTIRGYIELRCMALGVSVADVIGTARHSEIVAFRKTLICDVYQKFPDSSLPKIGKAFNRDHSTILHHLQKTGLRNGVRRWRQFPKATEKWITEEAIGQFTVRVTKRKVRYFAGRYSDLGSARRALEILRQAIAEGRFMVSAEIKEIVRSEGFDV